jgi:hypothetical protein
MCSTFSGGMPAISALRLVMGELDKAAAGIRLIACMRVLNGDSFCSSKSKHPF